MIFVLRKECEQDLALGMVERPVAVPSFKKLNAKRPFNTNFLFHICFTLDLKGQSNVDRGIWLLVFPKSASYYQSNTNTIHLLSFCLYNGH